MFHINKEVLMTQQRGILVLVLFCQAVLLNKNSKYIIVSQKPATNYMLVPVILTGNLNTISNKKPLSPLTTSSASINQFFQLPFSFTTTIDRLIKCKVAKPRGASRFLEQMYYFQLARMSSIGSMMELSQPLGSDRQISPLQRGSGYIPGERSGKWSQQEHMKYIVFIDYNKEKMRSKEKRRSNKFYEEMARFISTRNALQCRSHHQKLQEKYTHVNKIINVFKNIFNRTIYKHSLEQLDIINQEKPTEYTIRSMATDIPTTEVAVQTDLAGVNLEFITINPHLIVVQSQGPQFSYQQHMYPHVYGHMSMELSAHTLPSPNFYSGGMGWWAGCYPGRSGIN